jgi:hypothetical protein
MLPGYRRPNRRVGQRTVDTLNDPSDRKMTGHGLTVAAETPAGDARRDRPAVDADRDDVLHQQVADRTVADATNAPQLARPGLSPVVDRHPRAVVEGPETVTHGRPWGRVHLTPSARARVAGARDAGSPGESVDVCRSFRPGAS